MSDLEYEPWDEFTKDLTLKEYVDHLPEDHAARKELAELQEDSKVLRALEFERLCR
jgi:hypothetical protein